MRTLLPGATQLRHYSPRRHLRGDVIGGVTVTAYLVPQVMAYSALAGLPPQTGLWTIVVTLVVYSLLGTSRLLSVGPESTTALLTAATLGPLAAGDPVRYAQLAATLALICGLVALIAWLLRLGFLADLLSKPVLIGYMAGVAVIMVLSQLSKVTGVDAPGENAFGQLTSFLANVGATGLHLPTLILGLGVTVALVVGSRWSRVPTPLIVVLAATGVVAVFGLADAGIKTVGPVPWAPPQLGFVSLDLETVRALGLAAVGIVIVAYADNVLTGRAFAARHRHRIDSNSELLALAGVSVASSLVHGFPVSSSASRTVIAEASGARTQVHSLVAAAGTVMVLALFAGLLAAFPTAALGGLVIYAAIRLIDVAEFKRLWLFRHREFGIAAAATAGVLVFDILYGVLVAVGLSIVELLVRVARPHDGILGEVPGLAGWHDVDDYPDATQIPGLVVYRYDSPLFFANAEDFRTKAQDAVIGAHPRARWLLLNMEANVEVDITGLDSLDQLRAWCEDHGVVVALTRVKNDLRILLDRHGIGAAIGDDLIFPTLPTAVAGYRSWVASHPGSD